MIDYLKLPFACISRAGRLLIAAVAGIVPGIAAGQASPGLPFRLLPLDDLSAFHSEGSNWKIAGNVYADRHQEQALTITPGTGILANLSDPQNRSHLFSNFEHGDIEIEMEVLMVKGSNSGIYLQGRYELQLLDSWGKKEVKYGDMGGIYQRTDPVTQQGFEGRAPLLNACKAPGLWQKLYIHFRAPGFDAKGNKTADARFVRVTLNGTTIQRDVPVSGPTRSAAFTDERPLGPLMIQGNHGRLALRNIRYKLYDRQKVHLQNLDCTEYPTPGDSLKNFAGGKPAGTYRTDTLSWRISAPRETFLQVFRGELVFPEPGTYRFEMQTGGGGMLVIGRDTVILHDGANGFDRVASGLYQAAAGTMPVTLFYNKPLQWREGLALYAEGPGMERHPLHAEGSVFKEPPVQPMVISAAQGKARIQRSFIDTGQEKKTHCLSVGTPQGIHFSVDLQTGGLVQIWDGGFLNVTNMWHRRGNLQTGSPLGPVIALSGSNELLDKDGAGLPVQLQEYTVDSRGLPAFTYTAGKLVMTDRLAPSDQVRAVNRKLSIRGKQPFSYKLAAGKAIELLPDGSYSVDDKAYYLILNSKGLKPSVRKAGDRQELILAAPASGILEIDYSLLW